MYSGTINSVAVCFMFVVGERIRNCTYTPSLKKHIHLIFWHGKIIIMFQIFSLHITYVPYNFKTHNVIFIRPNVTTARKKHEAAITM